MVPCDETNLDGPPATPLAAEPIIRGPVPAAKLDTLLSDVNCRLPKAETDDAGETRSDLL